ncbi:MAG: hypothetical protein ACKO14_06355 [Armatimonadota bacterium]
MLGRTLITGLVAVCAVALFAGCSSSDKTMSNTEVKAMETPRGAPMPPEAMKAMQEATQKGQGGNPGGPPPGAMMPPGAAGK